MRKADRSAGLRRIEADRLWQHAIAQQREHPAETFAFAIANLNQYHWPEEKARERFQSLLEAGLVEPAGEGLFILADWRAWSRP